ncbi:MAG: hypothetical protein ACR2LM_00270 [Pyrinomonadaceae bacterium]
MKYSVLNSIHTRITRLVHAKKLTLAGILGALTLALACYPTTEVTTYSNSQDSARPNG